MNKLYPIQLWFTTIVFVAPLLIILAGLVSEEWNMGLEVLPLFIIFGLMFSLPSLLVCFAAYKILTMKISSPILIKILLNLIIVSAVLITLALISGSLAFRLSIVYSASILIASVFFSVKIKEKHGTITTLKG
ncbi:hypothetical protein I2I11_13450 [Pontibacter sp. 172403-2]|uniref:hypothetical protein n=1 Tax=Pontibacter rufus TaxID=2791028 RepID=UPI0018AF850C|nr:hypothetical protein [Pontibacter sp. 172403-2]MBF9254305.1 hypothetical protein [Pontibacter sp. 172403-2]